MKNLVSRFAVLALVTGSLALTACSDPPPPPPPPAPVAPPKPVIPEYAPTGDHADDKKAAAAGIDATNAADKAKGIETEIDAATKTLQDAKDAAAAAAAAKKPAGKK